MSANGQLTPDELALIPINDSINTFGAQYVSPPMLKYLLAAAGTFRSQRGQALFVKEGYRTLATQIDYFTTRYVQTPSGTVIWQGERWSKKSQAVATAAVPGTSNHGLGLAVDLWSGIDTSFTSADHLAFVAISKIYGFRNTGTAFGEPWHFEWSQANVSAGVTDVTITHPTSSGGTVVGTPTNGTDDEMTPEQAQQLQFIYNILATDNIDGADGGLRAQVVAAKKNAAAAQASSDNVAKIAQSIANTLTDAKVGVQTLVVKIASKLGL